ncbi:bifunctional protein-disulfide isomerase/oxidoreductase DsbC [Psychromonas arctica]|uniref:bifunctional protein-disulfide isomerase/oxidoreductase DsbC n=1 Tax=Psychromonas arctica TaxID=168275 RepID=UPI00040067D0|nr:bifunctional protein-disulfide isomerase/oxidoreductase DsbC [Psychromonas arctica]
MSILKAKKSVITFVVSILVSASSFAAVSNQVHDLLTKKLESLQVDAESITESPIKGLYEVVSEGAIYYLSEDGQFLISGSIYDTNNGMKNITAAKVSDIRRENTAEQFAKIKSFEKDMIVYKADNEKYVITAFTDITCAYCKKLHAEMADYNKLGITIRYLAFPRGGEKSNAYRNMVSVWCSDDPKSAMDDAKRGRRIKTMTCDNNVLEQYKLGIALGITGTPTMFLEDGTAMPGYLPADRLIQVLEEKI